MSFIKAKDLDNIRTGGSYIAYLGSVDEIWLSLTNKEAKKRIKEFTKNSNLCKKIENGNDVWVKPDDAQGIYGFFGRICTYDIKTDFESLIAATSNKNITLHRSKFLDKYFYVDPNKTIEKIFSENKNFIDKIK